MLRLLHEQLIASGAITLYLHEDLPLISILIGHWTVALELSTLGESFLKL